MTPRNEGKSPAKRPPGGQAGHRLRAMRDAVGLTQGGLALALSQALAGDEIDRAQVGKWESGSRRVPRSWSEPLVLVLHAHGLRVAGNTSLRELVQVATDSTQPEAFWAALWSGAWVLRDGRFHVGGDPLEWMKAALPSTEVPGGRAYHWYGGQELDRLRVLRD